MAETGPEMDSLIDENSHLISRLAHVENENDFLKEVRYIKCLEFLFFLLYVKNASSFLKQASFNERKYNNKKLEFIVKVKSS